MIDTTDHDSTEQNKKRLQQCEPFDSFCKRHKGCLHEFRTPDASESVRRMVVDLQDTAVLAAIEGGDLIAVLAVLSNMQRHLTKCTRQEKLLANKMLGQTFLLDR